MINQRIELGTHLLRDRFGRVGNLFKVHFLVESVASMDLAIGCAARSSRAGTALPGGRLLYVRLLALELVLAVLLLC